MPARLWTLQRSHASALSVWPLGTLPSVPAGGGSVPSSIDLTDGVVFDDALRNSWTYIGENATVAVESNPNVSTNASALVDWTHGLSYFTSAGFGKIRFAAPGGFSLDDFEYLTFRARTLTTNQVVNIYFRDAAFTIVGPVLQVTVTNKSYEDWKGGLRLFALAIGTHANLKDFLFSVPRPSVSYLYIEDDNASARGSGNKLYVSDLTFHRSNPTTNLNHATSYAENHDGSRGFYASNDPFNWLPTLNKPGTNPHAGTNFEPYWDAVDGSARGTTRQLMLHYARKWGFAVGTVDPVTGSGPPPTNVSGVDMIQGTQVATNFNELPMAQAAQESGWKNWTSSDWEQRTLNGITTYWHQSHGVGQQKTRYWPPDRYPQRSTAWSLDMKGAIMRYLVNGDDPLYPAADGNIRKALAMYFSGNPSASNQHSYACKILGGTSDSGPEHPISVDGFINDKGHNGTRDWTDPLWPAFFEDRA